MQPSFVSLRMRPTAAPIWLGIAVAASLIVIETVAVVYLKRLTGQTFGTLYFVDVMVVSTVWGFGLSAMTSVVTAIAYTYFRNWPHTHVGPDELGFWRSNPAFLFVAPSANTTAAPLASICCEPFEARSAATRPTAVTGAAVRQHEIQAGGDEPP